MFASALSPGASYREWAPPAALAAAVECLWTHGGGNDGDEEVRLVPPDNCADLLLEVYPDGSVASVSVVGAMTRPLAAAGGPHALVGLRFKPGCLAPALRVDGGELRDRRVALATMSTTLATSLGKGSAGECVNSLARIASTWQGPSPLVREAVDVLQRTHGSFRVERLSAQLGASRQWLARRFSAEVGVSPKTFARVARVEEALRAGRSGARWSQVAFALGYADQSHLINDVRAITGSTPGDSAPVSISARHEG